jgi:hypothetical protein
MTDQRITLEEVRSMFGPSIPIEAAQVLWCGLFDPDTARQKLKEIAARPPAAEASTEAVRVALDTLVAHIVERETYVGGPEQDAFHNANVVPAEHALDRALSALSASQAAMREAIEYAKWVIECGYSEKNMKLIYDRLDAVVPDPRAALRKLRDMMDEAGRK